MFTRPKNENARIYLPLYLLDEVRLEKLVKEKLVDNLV